MALGKETPTFDMYEVQDETNRGSMYTLGRFYYQGDAIATARAHKANNPDNTIYVRHVTVAEVEWTTPPLVAAAEALLVAAEADEHARSPRMSHDLARALGGLRTALEGAR